MLRKTVNIHKIQMYLDTNLLFLSRLSDMVTSPSSALAAASGLLASTCTSSFGWSNSDVETMFAVVYVKIKNANNAQLAHFLCPVAQRCHWQPVSFTKQNLKHYSNDSFSKCVLSKDADTYGRRGDWWSGEKSVGFFVFTLTFVLFRCRILETLKTNTILYFYFRSSHDLISYMLNKLYDYYLVFDK